MLLGKSRFLSRWKERIAMTSITICLLKAEMLCYSYLFFPHCWNVLTFEGFGISKTHLIVWISSHKPNDICLNIQLFMLYTPLFKKEGKMEGRRLQSVMFKYFFPRYSTFGFVPENCLADVQLNQLKVPWISLLSWIIWAPGFNFGLVPNSTLAL